VEGRDAPGGAATAARRPWAAVGAAGLALAIACLVLGAGYALTPATGGDGARRFAPWDPALDPWVGLAGVAGGTLIALTSVALARRLRGRGSSAGVGGAATVVAAFAVADALGLWLWATAEPPLPPSWAWLRPVHWAGLALAGVWAVVTTMAAWPRDRSSSAGPVSTT